MILILSYEGDEHADEVEVRLASRGRSFARVSTSDLSREGWLSLRSGGADPACATLGAGDREIRAADVTAVWMRRESDPALRFEPEDRALASYARAEWMQSLYMAWDALDVRWLPARPYDLWRADRKLSQLALAKRAGFTVPATLLTSSPEEVFAFYEACDGQVISKVPSAALFELPERPFMRFTRRVNRTDLGYLAGSLRHAPCLFQELVDKAFELRVTVVGRDVFCASVDASRDGRCDVDTRWADPEHTTYDVHPLPRDVEAKIVGIVEKLGLTYATLDFIVRPDGELVFLELNPAGQYLWIEHQTGLPISQAVCSFLCGDSREEHS